MPAHDARTPSVSTNQRADTDRNLVMTRVTTDDWSTEKRFTRIFGTFEMPKSVSHRERERERES